MKRSGTEEGAVRATPAWLLPVALLVFVTASLWHSYHEHVEQAEARALILARAVEQHATGTFDRASLALWAALQRVQPGDLDRNILSGERRQMLNNILSVQHRNARGVVSMSLTDADGIVLANSVGTSPGVDLGQRRYFQELKAGAPEAVVISEVLKGKVSNRWGLQVARRVNLPDGRFGGMVVANLGLYENFENFYKSLDPGHDSFIALLSQENSVLVRFPVIESALGKSVQGSRGAQAVSRQVDEQVVRSVSPVDGVDRIMSIRRLPHYPIYTAVGISYREVLLSWLKDSASLLILSFLIIPLVGLGLAMTRPRPATA